MSQVYESSYIVNSFHAVNPNGFTVYTPDEEGFITVKAGDQIVFESPCQDGKYVSVNTLVFYTKDRPLKVTVNPEDDRVLYPLYVPANGMKGVQYMRMNIITILNDCTFYYEGLAS